MIMGNVEICMPIQLERKSYYYNLTVVSYTTSTPFKGKIFILGILFHNILLPICVILNDRFQTIL
jgi:hypothetical protein